MDFLKKTVSRLIQFLSEKVSVDLAEFGRQAAEKLWDLAKKVKIFGLGNCRESSTKTCDDICFPSNQCWGSGSGSACFGLPDPDPLVRGTDPALDPDLHVFGPPGS
jgi:hypothetical protein